MKRFGRADPREKALAIQRSLDHLQSMSAKPDAERVMVPIPPEPKRRTRSASGKPLERDVLRSIIDMLRVHPKIGWWMRCQSGTFVDGNRYVKVGQRGVPDLVAMMKGTAQLVAIEVKREGGYASPEQKNFLSMLRVNGAKAGVARSVEEALAIIEQ